MNNPILFEVFLRGSAILVAGCLLLVASRRSDARIRCRITALLFGVLLILPLTVEVGLQWNVFPLPDQPSAPGGSLADSSIYIKELHRGDRGDPAAASTTTPALHREQTQSRVSWMQMIPFLYLIGIVFCFAPSLRAALRLRRMTKTSSLLQDKRLLALLKEAREIAGCRRGFQVRLGPASVMPMTWGVWKSVMILPDAALQWTDNRLRAILAHELAHIRRRDAVTAWASQVVRALYWPNPLAWWLVHRWQEDAEQACDTSVLEAGLDPGDYATALTDLARIHGASPTGLQTLALGVGRPSKLEDRVRQVLAARPGQDASRFQTAPLWICVSLCFALGAVAQEDENDPESRVSNQDGFIRFVDEKWEPGNGEPAGHGEPGQAESHLFTIKAALSNIIIPRYATKKATLEEAIETLEQATREHDPRDLPAEKKGINIIVDRRKISAEQPDALARELSFDLGPTPTKVLVEYITEVAGVSFRVEPYAVVIVPYNGQMEIQRADYRVRDDRVRNELMDGSAKDFLAEKGVNLGNDGAAFFIPAQDSLTVKAAPAELSKVDGIVAEFLTVPEQGHVIYSPETDQYAVANLTLCEQRFSPFSTYKIPHTILGIEFRYIRNREATWRYHPEEHPEQDWWPQSWARDHTVRSAFQNSVVWAYQDLAQWLEREQVRERLQQWSYGNGNVSGGQTEYWLGGGLEISAMEQVRFLSRLNEGRLDIEQDAVNLLKEIAFVEERNGKRLYAKTGTGQYNGAQWIGWYVGWIEEPGEEARYFAIICLDATFEKVREHRQNLTKTLLETELDFG